MSMEEYEQYLTVYDDGEVSDESFDPKYLDEVMQNEYFLNHLYKDGNLICGIRDSARNEYALIDGKCVMVAKFISWEKGWEKCQPLE